MTGKVEVIRAISRLAGDRHGSPPSPFRGIDANVDNHLCSHARHAFVDAIRGTIRKALSSTPTECSAVWFFVCRAKPTAQTPSGCLPTQRSHSSNGCERDGMASPLLFEDLVQPVEFDLVFEARIIDLAVCLTAFG